MGVAAVGVGTPAAGVEERPGVGAVTVGVAALSTPGVACGLGIAVLAGIGVAVRAAAGDGVAVDEGRGVGDGVAVGKGVGIGDRVPVGEGVGVGRGVGVVIEAAAGTAPNRTTANSEKREGDALSRLSRTLNVVTSGLQRSP